MTDMDAVIILMHLLRCGRVSELTTNEDAYRMVLEEFNLSFMEDEKRNKKYLIGFYLILIIMFIVMLILHQENKLK